MVEIHTTICRVSFSRHVHPSSYLGNICQAFVTFFLESKGIQGKRGKPYLGLGGGSLLGVRRGKVCLGLDEGSVSGIERGKCTWDKKGNCF